MEGGRARERGIGEGETGERGKGEGGREVVWI